MYRLEEETEDDWWEVEALYDLCFAPGRTALSSYRLREGVQKVAGLCLTLRITTSNDSINVQEAGTTITTTLSRFTPSVDLASGVYTWTVRAHDAAGNASAYVSPAEMFEIVDSSLEIYLPLISKKK